MSEFTHVNGPSLLRAIRRLANRRDWKLLERPGKGSHLVVALNDRRSVIPQHRADLPSGTFRAILKQLGLTPADLED